MLGKSDGGANAVLFWSAMSGLIREFDVVVVGGGHAGVEAAWACANIADAGAGLRVGLVTLDPEKIGVMSCNPAVGGLAKGQMVREVDALGGLMGLATDATGIMFKTLNATRGPAVRSPRAQCDRHAYAREVQRLVRSREAITVIGASVEAICTEERGGRRVVRGVVLKSVDELWDGVEVRARSVVLTTGTFMRGLMHRGDAKTEGGREGEGPARGISGALRELGFELGRLKTGTPPRLKRGSLDWDGLDEDGGEVDPTPFSVLTERSVFPVMEQVSCRVTRTTEAGHALIRENLHRAPMYTGQIESVGPRYCPSIEDKVVRFADRSSHHVFLEPESHESDWVYCNGIATSLPVDVQERLVHSMPGCERAEVVQWGYAVEYDMVRPHQIDAMGMTKLVEGLFLAGQINGTSGYEEAAGQGVVAGVNAARWAMGEALVTLGREQAYIGVMMDDLVTKTPVEPYRMFTSRAEHRLILRADNAADRLTELGRAWGVVDDARWSLQERRRGEIERVDALVESARCADGAWLRDVVRRPGYGAGDLARDLGLRPGVDVMWGVLETVHAERAYEGYIRRQRAEIRRHSTMERRAIPDGFDFARIEGLRSETKRNLSRFRPATIGQASRLEGVNPADITVLLVAMQKAQVAG